MNEPKLSLQKKKPKKPHIFKLTLHCAPFSISKWSIKTQAYLCAKAYSAFDQLTETRNQLTQDGHIQVLQALEKGKGPNKYIN